MDSSTRLPSERLTIVDALRGFALWGILIVHCLEQYYAAPTPKGYEEYAQHFPIDTVISGLSDVLLRGKFFMLFAFLFGVSFALQMQHMQQRGRAFQLRFMWRMVLLFAIGWIHQSFYGGDILTIYALLGVPLALCYGLPTRWLLGLAIVLLVGLPRLILLALQPDLDFESETVNLQTQVISYWNAVQQGSWWEVARVHSTQAFWMKMGFQFGIIGRGYQTFALFLLGMLAGREDFFMRFEEQSRLYRRGLWLSLAAIAALSLLGSLLFVGLQLGEKMTDRQNLFVGITFYDLGNVAIASAYIFAFLLLGRLPWWHGQLFKLVAFGRMALTHYVAQSVIGTGLLFGYGFGLFGRVGSGFMFMVAMSIFLCQQMASQCWLRYFHYGPLEWLWRAGTFGHWPPFLKKKAE